MLLFHFLEVKEGGLLGENKLFTKNVHIMISGHPKVGGGGWSPDWDTIPNCSVFFSDSPIYMTTIIY